MAPPLGWIEPVNRTAAQENAHADALAKMVKFALPPPKLAKGESIRLFDAWSHPLVVADVGFKFTRIHQLTGSCVWAGGTNAAFSSIAGQRLAASEPTKAFLPFTLHNYADSRHRYGDDSEGEGSLGSTFADSLRLLGLRDWDTSAGLPQYSQTDGISVTERTEMQWSSYSESLSAIQKIQPVAKTFGSTGECKTPDDIAAMNGNGYGVAFACNNYIGDAQIRGSGKNARVMGKWNGRGGHQQSIHAVEEHPDFGRIFWAQNNWPGSTYPIDPSGGPVCGCWVTEADVEAALRLDAEVYGYSHLPWFPAQPNIPEVLQWSLVGS